MSIGMSRAILKWLRPGRIYPHGDFQRVEFAETHELGISVLSFFFEMDYVSHHIITTCTARKLQLPPFTAVKPTTYPGAPGNLLGIQPNVFCQNRILKAWGEIP